MPALGCAQASAHPFDPSARSTSAASNIADGQTTVLNTLEAKFSSSSGVNVDDEMAHLLALQNAYAANARVLSVVKSMFDALMQA